MPPCSRVLQEKITRTALVASKWCSSTEPFEPAMSPPDHGWIFQDGKYKIKWFEGEAAPRSLDIILHDAAAEDDGEGDIEEEEDEIREEESADDDDDDDEESDDE